jgi:Tol biopolymer transport system component
MIAYTSDAAGNPDIWVMAAEGGEPLQLTHGLSLDTNPAWFPDKTAIAFESDSGGAPAIWQIPPLGGAAVKLLTNAGDPAISPDGFRIAFTRADPTGPLRIAVAPLDDLSRVRVLTGYDDGLWDHVNPAWSPDGRTICYAGFKNLWLIPADGGEATRLTHVGAADRGPEWSPDGRFVFFSSLPEESLALWCVRVSDGSVHRLTTGTSDEAEPSLSRDGRWLAYSVSDTNPDIGVLDRVTGLRTRIQGGAIDECPAVAPDGSAVAFSSDRRGSYDLWLQPLEGGRLDGPPRRLTKHPGSAAVAAFSPDGRWLAYHRIVDEQRDIWIVPSAGGPPQRITDHPANEIHPAFSPDGSMLAFVSDRDGVDHIWVAPLDDERRIGGPKQLTHGNATHMMPVWSKDGKRIACVIQLGYRSEACVIEVDSQAPPVHVTSGAGASQVRWSATGDELVVSGVWGTDRASLRIVSLRDGDTRSFAPAPDLGLDEFGAGRFGLDAAGRILAYEVIERRGDVVLAETDLGRRRGAPRR